MASLCFVTTCMGRLGHLKPTLGQVVRQHDSSCVVVDYSCPDRCGQWVETTYPEVHVVRLLGKKTFNRSIASNAGAAAVKAPWICFLDCDVFIEDNFSKNVLQILEPGYYYCPDPIHDPALCGTFICSSQDFERVGGYDEVYKGWGERDFDIYCALEYLGIKRRTFPSDWLRHIPHGVGSSVRFHDIRDVNLVHSINRIYRFVKFDMIYVGGILSLAHREELYERIWEKTKQEMLEGKPFELTVEIANHHVILEYCIRYDNRGTQRVLGLARRIYTACIKRVINQKHPESQTALDLTRVMYRRSLPCARTLLVNYHRGQGNDKDMARGDSGALNAQQGSIVSWASRL